MGKGEGERRGKRRQNLQVTEINPLSPDIKMHILLTVLHTFPMDLHVVRRTCLNNYQDILSLVITFFILIT